MVILRCDFAESLSANFPETNWLSQKLEISITSKLTKQFMSNDLGTLAG